MNVHYKFSPYAYQKLLFMRDIGETEVSGFGITDEKKGDLIVDFQLVKQECSAATTEMDKEGLSDYLEEMADNEIQPGNCMRVWIHTHPGDSPTPSGTDETTYEELSSKFPFFVMLIIAKGGAKFGRFHFSQGPGGNVAVTWDVDWTVPCEAADFAVWKEEYDGLVSTRTYTTTWAPQQSSYHYVNPKPTQYEKGWASIDWRESREEKDFYERDISMGLPLSNPAMDDEFDDWTDQQIEDALEVLNNKSVNEMSEAEWNFYNRMSMGD